MSKKYFCCSDIHSGYTPLKNALDKAGFDIDNKDHILLIAGDIFDRCGETIELYNFLKSLPRTRLILVRGNHEWLYLELLKKLYPDNYDFSNGTVKTFCHIAGIDPNLMSREYLTVEKAVNGLKFDVEDTLVETWLNVQEKVKNSEITKFIKSKRWKNYYELDNYVFVHSFIPLKIKDCPENNWIKHWPIYRVDEKYLEPVKNWRIEAAQYEWNDAMWGCPWQYYKSGLFNEEIANGKTLVCGHWHTSDFFKGFNIDSVNAYENFIFKGSEYNCGADNLIGLDACTVLSQRVNVLVIEK